MRKTAVSNTWRTREWKQNRAEFLAGKFCAWHGAPVKAAVPHHPQRRGTISKADYVSLKGCIPLCNQCHYAARKGLRLCPICKKHYFKPRRGRHTMCWECFSKTPFGKQVKAYWDEHSGAGTKSPRHEKSRT